MIIKCPYCGNTFICDDKCSTWTHHKPFTMLIPNEVLWFLALGGWLWWLSRS